MTSTGKAARRQHGTRFAAKRAKTRRATEKKFGHLDFSVERKNAGDAVRAGEELMAAAWAARSAKGYDPRRADVSAW